MPKISSKPKTKVVGANDVEVPGGYPVYPRPYYLTRTEGGTCRGYVFVSPGLTYRVQPTPDGFDIERITKGGTTNEKITKTVRYHVDNDLNVSKL